MTKYTKENLRPIFQSNFNLSNWSTLTKDLFQAKELRANPEEINTPTENEKGYYLGLLDTSDHYKIGFFYYEIKSGSVVHKKVGLRKLVKTFVNPHWGEFDAALVVFSDGEHWRLSLVCDIKEETMAPKRYTFVFGDSNILYRTAIGRFVKLQKEGISFKNIKEAFSVEKLSDEFFKEYKEQYQRFCDYLDGDKVMKENFRAFDSDSGKVIRDYVKKMMGRLVFLYFIQRKGWLNGNSDYLKALFSNADINVQDDFLDRVLEPMFFGILNTEESKREANALKNGWELSLLPGWKNIPYLNGGLFEQDELDKCESKFPREYFKKMFDFFSSYNFTIDENDPNDAEVGVDPEMLGKIFENLLEDNRENGAFYTPKEIVQYMCRESLIQYLVSHEPNLEEPIKKLVHKHEWSSELIHQEDALRINGLLCDVKICDPAIGSGAFPMGLLNEIFACRRLVCDKLNQAESLTNAQIKKEIISKNIYGVDIDKGAIDIARLRFWLAIVVDEKVAEPLPNLDYKIMQGDSLLESFNGYDLSEFLPKTKKGKIRESVFHGSASDSIQHRFIFDDEQESIDQIQKFMKRYFIISNHKRKKKLSRIIDERIKEHIVIESGNVEEVRQAVNGIDMDNKPFFLWHLYFAEVFRKGGFDIVLGNPPYIQLQKATGKKVLNKKGKEYDEKLGDRYVDAKFETFEKTGDIYCLFYEKGLDLLKSKGTLCYITSNKWMRAGYGKSTRDFFAKHSNPVQLFDFSGVKIFENATVDVNILLASKSKNQKKTKACILDCAKSLNDLSEFMAKKHSICSFTGSESWVVLSEIEQSIKRKIESVGTPLKDWDIKIYRGVLTGYNEAFIIPTETRDQILERCQDEEERKRTAELIRPILRGRDIKKYKNDWANLWLIATFPSKHYDIDLYPSVKKYLLSFARKQLIEAGYDWVANDYLEDYCYQKLSQTGEFILINKEHIFFGKTNQKARKKTRNKWFETQDSISYWEDFSKPKIVWKIIGCNINFSFDEKGMVCNNAVNIMTGEKEVLLQFIGLMNSKLFDWYLKLTTEAKVQGGGIQLYVTTLEETLLKLDFSDTLTNVILKRIDGNITDAALDTMIFEQYKLTEKERIYILNNSKDI